MRGRPTDPGTRKFRTSVLALATIAATALAGYIQSCSAQRQAEEAQASVSAKNDIAKSAEKKAERTEQKAEQTELKAEQTDVELSAAYRALADKMTGMEVKLDYTLKRIEFLENLLVRTSYHPSVRSYRPPSLPKSAKVKPLPPDPATAAIEQGVAPVKLQH